MCGSFLPMPIMSSEHSITINFVSDFSVADNGFNITYSSMLERKWIYLKLATILELHWLRVTFSNFTL